MECSMTKREKLDEVRALLEKAAVLLDDVDYVGEAEWARDVASSLEVVMSTDPEIDEAA